MSRHNMIVGVQMYSLRDFTRDRTETLDTLRKVKEMGYGSIQVQPDCCALSLTECGEEAKRLGLSVCATHVDYDWIVGDPSGVVDAHRAIGCSIVGIGEMPRRFQSSENGFREFARSLDGAARTIRAGGLRLVYHNHHFEFIRFSGHLGMDILLNESPSEMGFELDTYWVQAGGANPVEWIRRLSGRLPIVHFKDMKLNANWEQVFAAVGDGNLNWSEIVAACREAGVEYCIVELDRCDGSPFAEIESSLRYLKSHALY